MNVEDADEPGTFNSRLTLGTEEMQKKEIEEQGLENRDIDRIKDYFDAEIKGKDAKYVMKGFSKMFKDIKNDKLRKYFMQSVSQVHGMSFTFLANLVLYMCKQTD